MKTRRVGRWSGPPWNVGRLPVYSRSVMCGGSEQNSTGWSYFFGPGQRCRHMMAWVKLATQLQTLVSLCWSGPRQECAGNLFQENQLCARNIFMFYLILQRVAPDIFVGPSKLRWTYLMIFLLYFQCGEKNKPISWFNWPYRTARSNTAKQPNTHKENS